MRKLIGLLMVFMCVTTLTVTLACSSSGKSNQGVASIEKAAPREEPSYIAPTSTPAETETNTQDADSLPDSADPARDQNPTPTVQSTNKGQDSTNKPQTDEEIATAFAQCIRAQGFSISDPEVNADGTVDLSKLRASFIENNATLDALEACVSLLEQATFAQPPSEEDSIEVQDNLLKLTQCLRDKGLDVPDPEFSGGDPRMALRSIAIKVQQIEGSIDSVRSCGEEIFGGSLRRSR